ncbi:hypothetical protein AVEN_215620-1, partial [Araneus ventricosus]
EEEEGDCRMRGGCSESQFAECPAEVENIIFH